METTARAARGGATALREISLVFGSFVASLAVGFLLGSHVAPGSESAPWLSAFLLAAALVLAWKGVEVLLLLLAPLLLVRWLVRRLRGTAPSARAAGEPANVGRVFVLAYATLATLSGLVLGAFPAGWGVLASGALYAGVALALGIVFRRTVFLTGENGF